MESYTQAVKQYLENGHGLAGIIEHVTLDVFSGCTAAQLAQWETANRFGRA